MNIHKLWTIDPENYFELEKIKNQGLTIISIQLFCELSNRNLEEASIEDFLDLYTDLNEVIHPERNITVAIIFKDWFGYDFTHGNDNFYCRISITQVYEYMLEYLYDCCINAPTVMFADLSAYQELYEERLSEFKMYLPAEVDESDFIRSEIEKCVAVKLELEKPLYYIKYSRDSRNFRNFATILGSRLDKRIDFLKDKLSSLKAQITYPISTTQDVPAQYSTKQIALLAIYQGEHITRNNATEIARKHGHTSGEKLFQRYTYYSSMSNRKGYPGSELKLSNKIELFESVILILPEDKREKAQDELAILKLLRDKEN